MLLFIIDTPQWSEVHNTDNPKTNWIQDIMDMYNITNRELAMTSTVSEAEISDIKNCKKSPTHKTMLKICMGLELIINDGEFRTNDVFESNWKNVKFM